jgi:hypothetical protein
MAASANTRKGIITEAMKKSLPRKGITATAIMKIIAMPMRSRPFVNNA